MRALAVTSPRSILLILIVTALQSCSVGDYLEAYFNTYYNAQRLFSEAEEEIRSQKNTRQTDTTYLPPYNLQGTAKQKLTSVVEKCSKLLQYHGESSLVDDALMMIGKSYYYQNELQRAERKFGELVDGYAETDLGQEGKLLLAQTYYRMNEKEKALSVARTLTDSSGGDYPAISAGAFVLAGHVQAESGNLAGALEAFDYAAEQAETAAERTEAYTQVARMAERQNDFPRALEAYEDAASESPDYIAEYKAIIGQSLMLRKMGEHGDALDLLEDCRDNSNFREFNADTDLEIANVYRERGDIDEAIARYQEIDTTYVRTEAAARSYYQLGLLYETVKGDYKAALETYAGGKNQSPQSPVTPLITRRYNGLSRYKSISTEMARLESLKTVVLAPPESLATASETTTGQPDSSMQPKKSKPLPSLDSLNSALARNKAELGALFYGGLDRTDSAHYWYTNLLANHPGSPYSARALYTLAQISGTGEEARRRADSLYNEIVIQFPESEFADEARRFLGLPPREKVPDPADRLYAEGEFLLREDNADSAIAVFDSIVQTYPGSPLAPKAQYAIGWIYEERQLLPDSAIVHYQKLVALYPGTSYATRVTPKLNEAKSKPQGAAFPQPDNPKKARGPGGTVPPPIQGPQQVVRPDSVQNIPPVQQADDDSTWEEGDQINNPDPE